LNIRSIREEGEDARETVLIAQVGHVEVVHPPAFRRSSTNAAGNDSSQAEWRNLAVLRRRDRTEEERHSEKREEATVRRMEHRIAQMEGIHRRHISEVCP
jgi:hypothetical protein